MFKPIYRSIFGSNILASLLRRVATCWARCFWLEIASGHTFHATFVDRALLQDVVLVWPGSNNKQQCWALACALDRLATPNKSQHVATEWFNARNMLGAPIVQYIVQYAQYVVFKCCDRLAGACECWANNVAICCVEIGRGSTDY